jgi:outer membrane receptor protein involved in Fe transport
MSCSVLAIMTALSASAAAAQESQATTSEEVVVTGSLISRRDINSPSPISVITNQEIIDAGTLNLTEVLKQDPSLGVQSRSNTNTLNGSGASSVNLRNLGNRRTLALINGRRMPLFSDPLGNAFQDTTILPTNLLQRVDVLRDGASTTYGADAVAGVVNFILRDHYDGMQVEAYSGISDQGDAQAYRLSGLFGTTFDRGSIIVSALYQDQNPVHLSRRKWAVPRITSLTLPESPNNYGSNVTPGGAVLSTTGQQLACYPFVGGVVPTADPNCPRFDGAIQTSLINGVTLRNFGIVGRYDLTDKIRFSADIFQSRRESFSEIQAVQILTSGLTGIYPSGFRVAAASTNNPFGRDVNIRWRPVAYGSNPTYAVTNTAYANVGFDGKLFDDRLSWSLSHTYSESDATLRTPGNINSVSLFNLLNTQACAADIVCRGVGAVPNIPRLLTGATPLTQAQQDYLFYEQISDNNFSSAQTIATASGTLFTLPAGDVSAALGYEHRKETGSMIPDEITQSGVGIGTFIFPTDGEFTTDEVFAEINVPLLADMPLVDELALNVQGRRSHFSNFGDANTYKLGVNYAPVKDVRFRAAYGTSFRAPDVVELYGGGVGRRTALVDPCNTGAGTLRATNATVNANCLALGVPGVYAQPDTALPNRDGGNPGLQPEEGRTITFGAVITPSFWTDFTATVDAYDITIKNAIGSGNLQLNINNCYADAALVARSANTLDGCFSFAGRQSNGDLSRILTRAFNTQKQYTSGVDFNFNYKKKELPMIPGSFTTNLRLSYIRSFKNQGVELAGTLNGGVDGLASYPSWRGNLTGSYSINAFDFQWQVNYVDAVRDINYGGSIPVKNLKNYSGVSEYFSHDVLARWTPKEDLRLSVGVNNLFDKDPPYVFATARNSSAVLHDQIGRYFFMSLSKEF